MNAFFGSIWWLIVSLGLLVTFHEFGHYWVARRCGVKVLRFSVGFGRALWKRVGRDGTEYVIAALPLGGYVKMLDEREVEVAPAERAQAFNNKPVWQRIAIVAAGPLANLVLCVALLWAMFTIGKPDYLPVLGDVRGVAAESGFRSGDRLLSIDGEPTPSWTNAIHALMTPLIDRRPVDVVVQQADGRTAERRLALDRVDPLLREIAAFKQIGLVSRRASVPAVVGKVLPDGASADRLAEGDRIVEVGGTPVADFDAIGKAVQSLAKPGQPIAVLIEREGRRQTVSVTPRQQQVDGRSRWQLGIGAYAAPPDAMLRYGPIEAIPAAFAETWNTTKKIGGILVRLVSGRASLENISGPITIAQVANDSAQLGLAWFLSFLAMLSLSLAIMNLLPIPVLDGGHLLYYLIELVKGSPVSERVLMAGQYVGLALLAGLMGLAFYNDILRLVS